MLATLVEGAEAAGCSLKHVYCMEGTRVLHPAGRAFHAFSTAPSATPAKALALMPVALAPALFPRYQVVW